MFRPSVCWSNSTVRPDAVRTTFSMVSICASPVSLKLAPTCRVSVFAPPESSRSFCAPTMVSSPPPPLRLSAPVPPLMLSALGLPSTV